MNLPGFLTTFRTIVANDLIAEIRSKQNIVTLILFGVVLAHIFAFGFTNDAITNRRIFPGILWACIFFTATLGVGRTFSRETEDGAFTALILSPGDRAGLLVAKILVNFVLMVITIAFVFPLLVMLLDVRLVDPDDVSVTWVVCAQLLTGVIGFSVIATPLAVMAVSARFAEVLLPLIIFPMVTPVLIAGVSGTGIALGTVVGDSVLPWLQFTWAFSLIFGVLGVVLFEHMVTE
ncbi:MAG: heme exporter protein CcmB [Myxococcota bacterium]|nr:heme exporter protein CcmB [Myxococcota bacterium]